MVERKASVQEGSDIGDLLRGLSFELEEMSRRFAVRHGLHQTAGRALFALMEAADRGRPMTAGRLAESLGMSSAAVTALVDRMVSAGHVRRERDRADRRRVVLVTERTADELGEAFFRPLGEELARRTAEFDDAELDVVRRYLRTATEAVRRHARDQPWVTGEAAAPAPDRATRPGRGR